MADTVANTATEQDVYKWDTEQLEASSNILTESKGNVEELVNKLNTLKESLSAYWASTEASKSFLALMDDLIKDMGTYCTNIDNFNNTINQVIEIYDGAENTVSSKFGEINSAIGKISSVVE